MDQKWILNLVFLVFYQKMTAGAAGDLIVVKEGISVDIQCQPNEAGSILVWFRVLDTGMEFIASFTNTGIKKSTTNSPTSVFIYKKISQHILILQSFNRAKDSGAYSCASLVRGNELRFGKVTRLVGEKIREVNPTIPPLTTTITTSTTKPSLLTAATACVCDSKTEESSPSMVCAPFILGPLIGGCGLLLLLLITTTVYCNKIRTRRCPHHYKRKPRVTAGGIQSDKRLIK